MVRRFLHITTFLQGGAGRVVADLACAQRAAGHDVAVACAAEEASGYGHYPAWLTQLRDADIPVLPAACTFRRTLHHLMGAVGALERTPFVRGGVDLVHAHAAVPALVARAFARRAPVLATMHGWNAAKSADDVATDVAIFNGVPTVAVPSSAAARHLRDAGVASARIVVVPYGVAPRASRGLPRDHHALIDRWKADGKLVATCIGTLGARKRQEDLLMALATPGLRGHVACAFLGEANDTEAWPRRARELGLDADVAFLGCRDDVADWMQAADVTMFPSSREGLPIGLLEAQAAGAVCLVSDIDEHTGIVRDGVNGRVYPMGDVGALADRLAWCRRASADERRRLGDGARRLWRRAYQPSRMLARYDALYRDLMVAAERGALTA